MTDIQLYSQISALPPDLKQQVADFVSSLKIKQPKSRKKIKERQLGWGKGLVSMSRDFDEPLDDFKDYR